LIFRKVTTVLISVLLFSLTINSLNIVASGSLYREPHDPIIINGNEDLISTASLEGWSGTGSETSPIVIQGLSITPETYGIYIANVELHFRIVECLIESPEMGVDRSFGILLENCENAIIERITVWKQVFGICLWNSDRAFVNRTEIFECQYGVFVNESSGVWLHSLDIIVCEVGIELNHSINTYVDQTIIDHCVSSGIECINDSGTMLRHNYIISSEIGIIIVENENWVLEESIIQSCDTGIDTFHPDGGYVIRSMIKNCSAIGIDLGMYSTNISILQCWLGPDNVQNAQDDGDFNKWYDNFEQIGNYWSDYSGNGSYFIPGEAENVDPYPLSLEDAPKWDDVVTAVGAPSDNTNQTTIQPLDTDYFGLISIAITSASIIVIVLVAVAMFRSRLN